MSIDSSITGGYSTHFPTSAPGVGSTQQTSQAGASRASELDSLELGRQAESLNSMMDNLGLGPMSKLSIPQGEGRAAAARAADGTMAHLGSLSEDGVSADIFSFMALFQKIAQEMRNTARMERNTELQAQVTALQNAAEQMKTAAAFRFAAGMVQGAFQIAGGPMQIGMGAASASSTIKGARLEATGNSQVAQSSPGATGPMTSTQSKLNMAGNDNIAAGKELSAVGAKQQAYAQASGSIAGGVGGMIASGLNYGADMADARRSELETQAKVHETAVQHANDMMQQMMDVIRDVRDKLSSIQQAQIETNRSINRNV